MKKALYTAVAIAAMSLPTLAASAQVGVHTDGLGSNPIPQQIATTQLSVSSVALSLFFNFVLSL